MQRALVVSSGERNIEMLSGVLRQAGFAGIATATGGGEARRMLPECGAQLAVVNAPLMDESGEALARHLAEMGLGVLLICRPELFEEMSAAVEDLGVVTIARPVNQQLVWGAIKLVSASIRRFERMRQENQKLLQKIEDIRIIDRAKCLLISHLSLSEPDAHRYIERQAMDRRTTRRRVAEQILNTYET